MTLAQYMALYGLRDAEMAKRVGCDRTTITCLRNGAKIPSMTMACRIANATGGQVSLDGYPKVRQMLTDSAQTAQA